MRRDNNFDALRLLAAVAVLVSHAFLIAEGSEGREPLMRLTGGESKLGLVGVFIFFAISGFLVSESYEKTRSPLRCLAKRALRIFPGLFAALLVAAFVIGPLATRLPLADYLERQAVYSYVVGNTLLNLTTHELPGVLFVDNPVGLEVNASLWTLRYEFMMYLLGLGAARLLRWQMLLPLLALGLAWPYLPALAFLDAFGWLLPYFAMGMLLYALRDRGVFHRAGPWRPRPGSARQRRQCLSFRNLVALFDQDRADHACRRRQHRQFHLHRFEDDDLVALRDAGAGGHGDPHHHAHHLRSHRHFRHSRPLPRCPRQTIRGVAALASGRGAPAFAMTRPRRACL
jgi:Acyltransferase family